MPRRLSTTIAVALENTLNCNSVTGATWKEVNIGGGGWGVISSLIFPRSTIVDPQMSTATNLYPIISIFHNPPLLIFTVHDFLPWNSHMPHTPPPPPYFYFIISDTLSFSKISIYNNHLSRIRGLGRRLFGGSSVKSMGPKGRFEPHTDVYRRAIEGNNYWKTWLLYMNY